jgi:putative hydrolase of the HAD superfamily
MLILVLDVDGVLLDSNRGGAGHWSSELELHHGITRSQLQDAFFTRYWDDIVNGRREIEEGLREALKRLGTSVDCETVLSCWFEADFFPVESAIALAKRAAAAGVNVVLATNQEHRRAVFLRERLGMLMPIDDVLYSADLGHQKHERAFFEKASGRLGLRRGEGERVVFVDDLFVNVEMAEAAGWRGVHASDDNDWVAQVQRMLFESNSPMGEAAIARSQHDTAAEVASPKGSKRCV